MNSHSFFVIIELVMIMNIDIIIPAYNAKKTIMNTLQSIADQTYVKKCSVYIINDASDYTYVDEINHFSKCMNIKEIKLDKNVGPGEARNVGIKNSNNPYIVFIDSDDIFYSPLTIEKMYTNLINHNGDILISNFIYERDNKVMVKKKNLVWLHGKMYKRSFLTDNNILFNNTRSNEDNGFNRLCFLLNPVVINYDNITYVYRENPESITRKNNRLFRFSGIEGFVYNMNWAIQNAEKKGAASFRIVNVVIGVLVALYFYYMELYDEYDVERIIEWSKPMYDYYIKYEKDITKDMIDNFIKLKEKEYSYENKEYNKVLSFDEFLNKVEKNK